jgi:hypothetical protein
MRQDDPSRLDEKVRLAAAEVIRAAAVDDAGSLLDQLSETRVLRGPVTFLELSVPPSAPRSTVPDGPLPGRVFVVDGTGQPSGEIIVWIEHGYLSALEYAWYTDEPPEEWPSPGDLRPDDGPDR